MKRVKNYHTKTSTANGSIATGIRPPALLGVTTTDMKIHRDEKESLVESLLFGDNEISAKIEHTGTSNSDAAFELIIKEGGQVWEGCHVRMVGCGERNDLLDFLKVVVQEMEYWEEVRSKSV